MKKLNFSTNGHFPSFLCTIASRIPCAIEGSKAGLPVGIELCDSPPLCAYVLFTICLASQGQLPHELSLLHLCQPWGLRRASFKTMSRMLGFRICLWPLSLGTKPRWAHMERDVGERRTGFASVAWTCPPLLLSSGLGNVCSQDGSDHVRGLTRQSHMCVWIHASHPAHPVSGLSGCSLLGIKYTL